jgi:hypothetical protein
MMRLIVIASAFMLSLGVAEAKEPSAATPLPRAVTKEAPAGHALKESSKLGPPAEKYEYIYRVSDKPQPSERRDVI